MLSDKEKFNTTLSNYDYLHRKINVRSIPGIWFIETTNFCNLDCIMCPRRYMTREIGYMDFNLFKKVINQIRGYTDFVWLHLFGEPLFHPQLEQFIKYSTENGVKAGISSNATILDEEKSKMLLNSGLHHIIISIDGAKKESYEKIRQNADFEKVRLNALNFLRFKEKLKNKSLLTEIQIIHMDETEDEIEEFNSQWEDLADRVIIKQFINWGNQVESIGNLYKNKQKPDLKAGNKRYPCINLWFSGGILWNGDVVFCCRDFNGSAIAGNIGEGDLLSIWNSETMKSIRKEHIENSYKNPLCINCSEWVWLEG